MFLKTPDQTRPDHLLLAVAKLGVLVVGSEQMKTPELINCPGGVMVVVVVMVQHDNVSFWSQIPPLFGCLGCLFSVQQIENKLY